MDVLDIRNTPASGRLAQHTQEQHPALDAIAKMTKGHANHSHRASKHGTCPKSVQPIGSGN
jgi:hypothetical protein